MKKKYIAVLTVVICAALIVGVIAFASSDSSDMRAGAAYRDAAEDKSAKVAAVYRGEEILMSVVQYEKDMLFMRDTSGQAARQSDRDIVDRIVESMIMLDEAEKRGLLATEEEIAEMVENTKLAYEMPDGKKQMDEYFEAAGLTADEYFEQIEQQAPNVIARQKLRDAIAEEYCKEHGMEYTKVNTPQEVLDAVDDYIAALLEEGRKDIVYYVD